MSNFAGRSELTRAWLGFSLVFLAPTLWAADAGTNEKSVISRLKAAKHTLLEGIQSLEKQNSTPISAKLEVEEGRLWLSVYGAKSGLHKCAEKNVLFEVKGDAAAAKWEPTTEVFEDREHLARASTHLTLMQTTSLTLAHAVELVAGSGKGHVYSAIPALKDGKTVIDVKVASAAGQTAHVFVDETSK
jgi:hypothetical protein